MKTIVNYIVNSKDKAWILSALKDYLQLENLLILLLRETIPAAGSDHSAWERWFLLTNRVLMKAVLKENSGGPKTRESIERINRYFGDQPFLKRAIEHCRDKKINGHNASMIVSRLKSQFDKSLKGFKRARQDPSQPLPSLPKPKRLQKKVSFSLPFEKSKYSLKNDRLYLNFFNKRRSIFFPRKGILSEIDIKNIVVGFKHSDVYIGLGYLPDKEVDKETTEQTTAEQPIAQQSTTEQCVSEQCVSEQSAVGSVTAQELSPEPPKRSAGLDIGLKNLFTLYVDDKDTPSLVYRGKGLIKLNVSANRRIAQLQREISALQPPRSKGKSTSARDTFNPKLYRAHYELKQIFAHRSRSFKGQFEQISSLIIRYLNKAQVNHLVISKNLSFAKQEGRIRLRRPTQQTFYQIPFGALLNLLERKCKEAGIQVECVNEAWTSQVSVLSGDVCQVQSRTPTDKKPCRGVKGGARVHRGLYIDDVKKIAYHADVGAAANHIRLANPHSLKWLDQSLHKLCNPKVIKSTYEFSCFLRSE